MTFLLDTHAFIWALSEPGKLPNKAKGVIEDPHSEIFVSSVTFWEMAIKVRNKRLAPIGHPDSTPVATAISTGFHPISLEPLEAATQGQLTEDTHFDPFDRMLICQAISRKLTLISGDKEFERFRRDGLKLLWR